MKKAQLHQRSKAWLSEAAIPLWFKNGIDREQGGFYETLSSNGIAMDVPKRTMVQARQIYSFKTALELECLEKNAASEAVSHGLEFLLKHCSLSSGAFVHSVERNGKSHKMTPDLYAQAFALFGMAHAFSIAPSAAIKERAQALVQYLQSERRLSEGGYFELQSSGRTYESNPQMHLFEPALSWMDVDPDPAWRKLADELAKLCVEKFIDAETGALCERFEEGWKPVRENKRFVFEPGHHYEWAWLLGRYQKHTGKNLHAVRSTLFELSEKNGICPSRRTAYDELWSDLSCKTSTSRFWPQCERIKAALQLGAEAPKEHRKKYLDAADEALSALFRFLETPQPGLWFDRCSDDFEFIDQPAKASSLYHIIGAIREYHLSHPELTD